jgi:type 1 glutamine amidotransferase
MRLRFPAALLLLTAAATAAPKRVLYLTATYGYRHSDSIDASVQVLNELATQSGALEIVHTEDVSWISADRLRDFDAVYFFTSGELPLTDTQKSDLLAFIRDGKGFGGSHSATDTLYTWPEYGQMIGGIFDGHPWVQEANVDVEDPENQIVASLAPNFRAEEEFYQFRNFSRDSVRVLLTLDPRSVNLAADGVHRTDGDFALAWVRNYGRGRVFYSAFGHFPGSFTGPPFRAMLLQALLWLTGQIDFDASPRVVTPAPASVRVVGGAADAVAPGALVTISGEKLTSGSSLAAASVPLPVRLAGTRVEVNGIPAPLFSVKPGEIEAQLPYGLRPGEPANLTVASATQTGLPVALRVERATPAIVAGARNRNVLVLYAVGLGAVDPAVADGVAATDGRTVLQPAVTATGLPATVFYSGVAPGLVGVYQINAVLPRTAAGPLDIVVTVDTRSSPVFDLGRR